MRMMGHFSETPQPLRNIANGIFPAEKSVDFPPWGLQRFAGNPVISAVKCRLPHPAGGENDRRILQRSFRVAVKGSPNF